MKWVSKQQYFGHSLFHFFTLIIKFLLSSTSNLQRTPDNLNFFAKLLFFICELIFYQRIFLFYQRIVKIKKSLPHTAARLSKINTYSYTDRVPIGEQRYGTYPIRFLLLPQSVRRCAHQDPLR